jgi:hypothetical protein
MPFDVATCYNRHERTTFNDPNCHDECLDLVSHVQGRSRLASGAVARLPAESTTALLSMPHAPPLDCHTGEQSMSVSMGSWSARATLVWRALWQLKGRAPRAVHEHFTSAVVHVVRVIDMDIHCLLCHYPPSAFPELQLPPPGPSR